MGVETGVISESVGAVPSYKILNWRAGLLGLKAISKEFAIFISTVTTPSVVGMIWAV